MRRSLASAAIVLTGGLWMASEATPAGPRPQTDSPATDDAAEPASERRAAPKRIVICMDGTWNNPAKRKERDDGDEVFKPTNVLKTCRALLDLDDVTATLVLTGQPLEGEVVRIDGTTYTFRTELSEEPGCVRIGATPQDSLENLRFAIDLRRGRNRYSAATVRHPSVEARAVPGDRLSMELGARTGAAPGGDPFAVDTNLTHGYWAEKREISAEFRRRGLDPAAGIPQLGYYDIGVGALRRYPGFANALHRQVDKVLGGTVGAGFEGNIEDAYTFLAVNYREGDQIFVFGFSRGASSARGLVRFIDWMGGVLPPGDSYWVPRYYPAFLKGEAFEATREAILQERIRRRIRRGATPEEAERRAARIVGTVTPARVRFLGVWDTVLSLGKKRERPHVGPVPPAIVDHVRQALAIDERRAAFQPRIWERPFDERQTLEQRWFAGVHTNIGGGYVNDGLANLALKWMMGEARDAGLGLDWSFLRRYPGYPQDQLYNSMKPHWRILQTISFRRGKGVRRLRVSPEAGLTFHASVFDRLASVREEEGRVHEKLEPYRPENLLRFLASHADLEGFLASVPGLRPDYELPDDVAAAIRRHRQ